MNQAELPQPSTRGGPRLTSGPRSGAEVELDWNVKIFHRIFKAPIINANLLALIGSLGSCRCSSSCCTRLPWCNSFADLRLAVFQIARSHVSTLKCSALSVWCTKCEMGPVVSNRTLLLFTKTTLFFNRLLFMHFCMLRCANAHPCAQNIKCFGQKCAIWNTQLDWLGLLLEECEHLWLQNKKKTPHISRCHTQDVQQGRAQSDKKKNLSNLSCDQ